MRHVELRHLRYFIAVAEQLHFGRAAAQLGVAQPPLSQQIQHLERLVGESLFTRRPAVRLTEAGETFLQYARKSLEAISTGLNAARRVGAGTAGQLTVGFAASALLSPMTEAIRSYRSAFPGVELVLRELATAEQISQLQDGRIDVGFLRMPPVDTSGIVLEQILEEPFIAVLTRGHAASGFSSLRLESLRDAPFVLFPREVAPSLYDQVQAIFRRAGFEPNVVVQAREWLTIVGLVEAGIGVSVVPDSFRRLGWGDVTYSALDDVPESTGLFLGTSVGGGTPALAGFIKTTLAAFNRATGP